MLKSEKILSKPITWDSSVKKVDPVLLVETANVIASKFRFVVD